LKVPQAVPGVPTKIMNARSTWPDGAAYDAQARKLADMFRKNFERFGDAVSGRVRAAGPKG
jgi:phosphoenolpyruvate carboxykinase (ATP)